MTFDIADVSKRNHRMVSKADAYYGVARTSKEVYHFLSFVLSVSREFDGYYTERSERYGYARMLTLSPSYA